MQMLQESFAGVVPSGTCKVCGRPLSNPSSVAAGIGPICSGKGHYSGTIQKKETVDMSQWGMRFDYRGYWGTEAHCYLLIHDNTVIATESPDNHSTSITNLAEVIATQVCRQYKIPLDKLVWIEHYLHTGMRDIPETFSFVTFVIEGDKLAHPKWRHAPSKEAMGAFGDIVDGKVVDAQ